MNASRLPLAVALVMAAAVALAAAARSQSGEGPASPIERLSFLAGSWRAESPDGAFEEYWTRPVGGTMIGMGRFIAGGRTAFVEYLRIDATEGGSVVMTVFVGGRGGPGHAFPLVHAADDEAAFEDPGHDFPRRIAYRRESPDALTATLDGDENGIPKKETLRFRRARLD